MIISRRMNYGDDVQFAAVLKRYGGKKYLEEKFPRILQMLNDTREWHKFCLSIDENGYTDAFHIKEIPIGTEKKESVFADSSMSMVKKHSFLIMTGEVSDPKQGKIFSAYSVKAEKSANLSKDLTIDSSYLSYCKSPSVQAHTSFTAIDKINGKAICTADVPDKYMDIDVPDDGPIVKKITVDQPASKNASDTFIRLVYNGRQDNDAAYNFKTATDRYINDKRYVTVYYPFSVKVELDSDFEFDSSEPVNFDNNFYASLVSNVILGGEVHFNSAVWDKITTKVENNVLTLDFPYSSDTDNNYWNVEMPLTAKQAEGYFNFHLNFSLNFRIKGNTEKLKTAILISSEDLPVSPNFVKIKQSRILWGCLGKDTIIRTESGNKKIEDIKVGEKILTEKGFIPLKNMITGIEKSIIAVSVSEETTLFITKNHPIATDRGTIRAIDLTITDKLKIEDGSYQKIYYLEVLDYNKKVYCPELEESSLIVANGIMVGDYFTPFTDSEIEEEREPESLEPELIEELNQWVSITNRQQERRVNI